MTETKTWSTPNIETCLRKQALIDGSFIFCHARMVVDKFVVPQDHKLSAWYKRWIGPSDPRTIGLFFWTIFLDYFFWTIFGPFSLDLLLDQFLDHFFGPFYWRGDRPLGCSLSVLRKGWGASCCSYKLLERFFERLFFTSNCLRWTAAFLYIFDMRMRNWHLNTGQ